MGSGSTSVRVRWLFEILGVAAAYLVVGRLSLHLAIPPGYATAVWPAAGIALAATLLLGTRVWPGILLASVLINIWTAFDPGSTGSILKSILLPLSIGSGATLQAVAGAALVRRLGGFPNSLARAQDVIRFLVLGGPVSCLISATIGVLSLRTAGLISTAECSFHWWTWWVGDTIGTLALAPLILIWTSPAARISGRRRIQVSIPLGLAFGLVVVLFMYTRAWEQERTVLEFQRRTESLARTIERSLARYMEVLGAVGGLFGGNLEVNRQGFEGFVAPFLARHPGIHAISWNPSVPEERRTAFEDAARREGYADFRITELDNQGQSVTAPSRPSYVPVFYTEPLTGNEKAIGFNIASDPNRGEALETARDTGRPAASKAIALVTDRELGLLVILPVYEGHGPLPSVEQRRQSLRGCVAAVFRINNMIRASLSGVERADLAIQVFEETALAEPQLLWEDGLRTEPVLGTLVAKGGPLNNIRNRVNLDMAGRTWSIEFSPASGSMTRQQSRQAWSVLAGGLMFTGLLGALLLVVTGRTAEVEELVGQRTVELRKANDDLRHHLGELARVEGHLRRAQDELELRVRERTEQLALANAALQREIQRQEQSEAALRLQQRELAHFAAIVESSSDGILSLDLKGRILSWNPGAERLYGFTAAEMRGQSLSRLVSPDHQGEDERIVAGLASGEHFRRIETKHRRQDGRDIDVALTISPICDAQGCLEGASVVARDITERKQAEERFRIAVEAAPNAMLAVDQQGRITLVNSQAERLFGYRREELMGQPVEMLVPERYRGGHPGHRANFYSTPAARPMGAGRDLFGLRNDGTEVPIEIGLNPIQTAQGTLVLASIIDITERKGAENALKQSLRESRALIERQEKLASLGVLAAGVAHEIRNPLTAIKFRLFSLRKSLPVTEAENEDAAVIASEINRLDRIVRDFLLFARPTEPELVQVPVDRLLCDVQELLKPQLAKARIQLNVEPGSDGWVRADTQQLKQVLINLIQNAAESIGSDGTITLRIAKGQADAPPEAVVLEVADTGKGIPPEVQRRLFDPFFTTKEGGTGLGLPIAARIVEKHGGELRYQTQLNHGTTFQIVLPKAGNHETQNSHHRG